MIDNIGHMFGLLGTLLGTMQNLRIQCEHVSPQQLYKDLKCKTKAQLSTSHTFFAE